MVDDSTGGVRTLLRAPHGLDGLITVFGDCHGIGWEVENIAPFTLPYPLVYGTAMVRRSRCHRLLVPVFQAVFEEIKAQGLQDFATHYSGIYEQRGIRGFPKFPSTHSWGIAIDLNAENNPRGGQNHQHEGITAIFVQKFGFTHGAGFASRSDPMHYQYVSGY